MNNPTGELLIGIKNAYLARHESAQLPYSNFVEKLAKILADHGYIGKIETKDGKTLVVELKYRNKRPVLVGVKQISKPGLRRYFGIGDLARLRRRGPSLVILSTSKGLLSLGEAKKQNIGGELLCEVW